MPKYGKHSKKHKAPKMHERYAHYDEPVHSAEMMYPQDEEIYSAVEPEPESGPIHSAMKVSRESEYLHSSRSMPGVAAPDSPLYSSAS